VKLSDFSFVPHTFMSHWVLLGVLGLAKGITSTLHIFVLHADDLQSSSLPYKWLVII